MDLCYWYQAPRCSQGGNCNRANGIAAPKTSNPVAGFSVNRQMRGENGDGRNTSIERRAWRGSRPEELGQWRLQVNCDISSGYQWLAPFGRLARLAVAGTRSEGREREREREGKRERDGGLFAGSIPFSGVSLRATGRCYRHDGAHWTEGPGSNSAWHLHGLSLDPRTQTRTDNGEQTKPSHRLNSKCSMRV